MKERLLIGYLCYLNETNKNRRSHNFYKSLKSMSLLEKQPCKVIAIKNNCSLDVEKDVDNQLGINDGITFKIAGCS